MTFVRYYYAPRQIQLSIFPINTAAAPDNSRRLRLRLDVAPNTREEDVRSGDAALPMWWSGVAEVGE